MLRDIDFGISYASTSASLGKEFLCPALAESSIYRRVTGYFSSSLWILIQTELVDFVDRGGKMYLVCSPAMSHRDLDAIAEGQHDPSALQKYAGKNIQSFVEDPDNNGSGALLCYLIASGILEIRFAFLTDEHFESSIFHEKFGYFEDSQGESVSFIGSVNETVQGWSEKGNGESIEVFLSWISDRDALRIENHKKRFKSIWNNEYDSLNVYPPDKEVLDIARNYAAEGAQVFRKLVARRKMETNSENLKSPKPLPLMSHQSSVIKDWENKGFKGLVEFCTGAGKTFVGLEVIRRNGKFNLPTVIIVPSELLFEQWQEEIAAKIPETYVIPVSGQTRQWRNLRRFRRSISMCSETRPVAVVVTIGSMVKETFQNHISGPQNYAVIADEAHQCGAPLIQSVLRQTNPIRVLGLSATPERFGDEEGTKFIFEFFGEKLDPQISLDDAIRMERLVPYEYHPHFVRLSEEEVERWNTLSIEIARLYGRAKANGDPEAFKFAEMKSHERSRIAKKAEAKTSTVASVLQREFSSGDKWLVYCEDQDHIAEIATALKPSNIPLVVYHSDLEKEQKKSALEWIDWNDGVVLSIRCLDEGVDIPAVDKALIVSSSQNPRQFVQRRGRVLRKSKFKERAIIHDILVLPSVVDFGDRFERLVFAEIARAYEFSKTAINASAQAKINAELANLGLNLDTLNIGEEVDE